MRMAKKANVAPGTTTTTTAQEETGKTAGQGTASKLLKVRKWPRDRRGSSGGREGTTTTVTGSPGTRKTVSRKVRMEHPGGTTTVAVATTGGTTVTGGRKITRSTGTRPAIRSRRRSRKN